MLKETVTIDILGQGFLSGVSGGTNFFLILSGITDEDNFSPLFRKPVLYLVSDLFRVYELF